MLWGKGLQRNYLKTLISSCERYGKFYQYNCNGKSKIQEGINGIPSAYRNTNKGMTKFY